MIFQRGPKYSLITVYVLTIRVFGLSAKDCGTGSEYIPFFTTNGILNFCLEENGSVNVVTHQQDLKDLFPDVDIDAL